MSTSTTRSEVDARRAQQCRAKSMSSSLQIGIQRDLEYRFEATRDEQERDAIRRSLNLADAERWPSERYRKCPAAFARDVLGVELWDKQEEIVNAVRDYPRVAVASGHKVGKSMTDAVVALWFFCAYEEARVVMSSVTARQVDQILWRELRMLYRRALKPIGGELHDLARSGLKSSDFREVVGFTAREAEAVAGVSGKNLIYILDESSGIGEDIFEAIEGNRAGGARLLMTSNPTRPEGRFFEAFHGLRRSDSNPNGIHCIEVSSEDSPNVKAGRVVIPGLATREWIEEKKLEWGEDSALYQVRVRGKFVRKEEGKVISLHNIELAEQRWKDAPCDGVLTVGLDPAGGGVDGDETIYAPKRGLKILELTARRGLSEDGIVVNLVGLLRELRIPGERPRVIYDREGDIGSKLHRRIQEYLYRFRQDEKPFDAYPVRASDRATRHADVWDRQRDALWGNLADWLRPTERGGEGGAIPEDSKLAAELHAPEMLEGKMGRRKVTPKPELRRKLGRSPDRADAVALAVWEPRSWEGFQADEMSEELPEKPHIIDPFSGLIDPYGGMRR